MNTLDFFFLSVAFWLTEMTPIESKKLMETDICATAKDYCHGLAKRGACSIDNIFMNKHCEGVCENCKQGTQLLNFSRSTLPVAKHGKVSSETDYDCKDGDAAWENPQCESFATEEDCKDRTPLLELYCRETCGYCSFDGLCLNRNKKCTDLAKTGFCENNETYMNEFCPAACEKCETFCLDISRQCGQLSADGHCANISGALIELCPLSCGLCGPNGLCLDKNKNCSELAGKGECGADLAYMTEFCPFSCKKCGKEGLCQDRAKNCLKLAEKGDCQKNLSMAEMCPSTCGRCRELKLIEDLRKQVAELESMSQCSNCEKEPKSNFVTLFEDPNQKGASINRTLDICCTLNHPWKDRASSLTTDAGCVRVFTGDNCVGENVFLKSNFDNIHQLGWGDRIQSTYKCSYE